MAESDKDQELRELRARLEVLEGSRATAAPSVPPLATKKNSNLGCSVLAVLGLLAVVGFCSSQGDGTSSSSTPLAAAAPTWTPPAGYELYTSRRGGSIGVQWEKPTRAECRGSGVTCFAVNVVTENACPRSLYASITLFNAAGENMGWTNDTAQGVMAGEKTRLVFDTYERGVESARIAEINCY